MADTTSIEWTNTYHEDGTVTAGSTWNPIRGQNARHTCARISPGCDNCYAATMTRRGLMGTAPIDYGVGETPNDPARLDETVLTQPSRWKKPRKVFVCSMTDLFGEWVPAEWLDRIFAEMENTPRHTYIVLTKRPTRMRDYINRAWPYPYQSQFIWLGASIESDRYTWRANVLRQTNAAVRWVSAEPLLGPLDSLNLTGIDWLVTGGESGPGARPIRSDWVRDIRDRCQANGTAYFHKQWGAWQPVEQSDEMVPSTTREHVWPDGSIAFRLGNHKTGRLLDGREWNEFPSVGQPTGAP